MEDYKDYKNKYEEALERARKINNGDGIAAPFDYTICEVIFPELKESEDERMIKSLKRLITDYYDVNFPTLEGFKKEDIIAWVEKKGEQKPAWSEEDEGMLQTVINRLELSKNRNTSEIPYVERCVE